MGRSTPELRDPGAPTVCLVSHSGYISGADLALVDLARGLQEVGWRPSVLVPVDGPVAARLRSSGISVETADLSPWAYAERVSFRQRFKDLARGVLYLKRTVRQLRTVAPEILVSNTVIPFGFALAARLCGVPHVWSIHELPQREAPLQFTLGSRLTLKLIGRLSHLVLVPSQVGRDAIGPLVHPARVAVVESPVSNPTPEPHPWTALHRVAMVGSLSPVKRVTDLLEAMALIRTEGHSNIELWLVGHEERTYGAHLRSEVERLELTGVTQLTGHLEDPWAQLVDGTALVSCSVSETFGRVVVEAMQRGLPVVLPDVALSRSLAVNGETALLYRPSDTEHLAQCIMSLATDPRLARRLGENARVATVGKFSPRRYAESLLAAVAELLPEAIDRESRT